MELLYTKPLYTVRIAKNDSVTNVVYEDIIHVWWQDDVLVMESGERGKDRSYIYYPVGNIDHVHVLENNDV